MKRNLLKTKEFKIKLMVSIILLISFVLSFLFANQIQTALGIEQYYSKNETSEENLTNLSYKVHYLDVGQGNCTVVELPDDKIMIIDGGSDMYGQKISDFLKEKEISKIDYMIATHADSDHIGGLNYLFDDFEIVNIFRPMQIAGTQIEEIDSKGDISSHFEVFEDEDLKQAYKIYGSSKFVEVTSQRYREFIKNIYSETYSIDGKIYNSDVTVFYDGLKVIGEDYEINFYAPLKIEEEVNFESVSNTKGFMTKIYSVDASNNSSAIFLLKINNEKYFFSGDASATRDEDDDVKKFEESDFIQGLTDDEKYELSSVDVYLVAHHGSKYGSSDALLKLIKPNYVILSVGKNNYGHPSEEVLFRLNQINSLEDDGILCTSNSGNITFSSTEETLIYALEKTTKKYNLFIKYEALMIILFVMIESIILNIRPQSKKRLTCDKNI